MRTVIGVMGGAEASDKTQADAYELGRLIAQNNWVLLNGGRDVGVMAASARGASESGGLVIGVLPDDSVDRASPHLDVAILTGMGDARNAVNVLSSNVVIALRGGAGTLSEVALALKSGRPVIALDFSLGRAFIPYYDAGLLVDAASPREAIGLARQLVDAQGRA